MDTQRPGLCRNALRDAGKPYPRSGCAVCKSGGLTGCPYEKTPVPTMTDDARVPVTVEDREAAAVKVTRELIDAGARMESTLHKINGHWWNKRIRPDACDLRIVLDFVAAAAICQMGGE